MPQLRQHSGKLGSQSLRQLVNWQKLNKPSSFVRILPNRSKKGRFVNDGFRKTAARTNISRLQAAEHTAFTSSTTIIPASQALSIARTVKPAFAQTIRNGGS